MLNTLASTGLLRVTVVVVTLFTTVVPGEICEPLTVMPAVIASVADAPAKVTVSPAGIFTFGVAVLGELRS